MSTHARAGTPPADRPRSTRATERLLLGGLMMFVTGAWSAFMGVSGLFVDTIFAVREDYLYGLDMSTWAWVQLTSGVITVVVGFWVIRSGTGAARTVAVVVVGLGAVAGFLFVPYHPVWSVLGIALDLVVVWALTAGQRVR
jgi:hypothetical protein